MGFGLSMQQHFQDKLVAQISQQQQHKTTYSPVHRDTPAPAVKTMSPQQHCEYSPRYKTEQDFVIELPGLAEYFFGKHHAGCQCQRQQHETDTYPVSYTHLTLPTMYSV